MEPASDIELFEAWRGGDQRAGAELFRRHYDTLTRFFANKVAAEHRPELIQRTMLACVESSERFEGRSRFSSYLLGIALRQLYKHFDRRRRGERVDFGTVSIEDLEPSPSQAIAAQDEYHVLLQALRRLPLDYQLVLELVYWEDFTAAEVAESLDIPVGTAKTRIRRGKELLREQVETVSVSPALMQSTISNLEGWARALRERG